MKKFVTPGKMPTPYEAELLTIMMEECAEVIQRASKTLRFGIDEVEPGQKLDNTQRTSFEVGDLMAVFEKCSKAGLLDEDIIIAQIPIKMEKLEKYMQRQAEFTLGESKLNGTDKLA